MGLWKDRQPLTIAEMQEKFGDAYTPPINQCDGCRRSLATRLTEHGSLIHDGADGMPVMICTADRYQPRDINASGGKP